METPDSEKFTCCGHPFATAQTLKRHKVSLSHRRSTDPEFAKTEAAEKADVKCKRKREKDSKAVQQADARKRLRLSKQRLEELDRFAEHVAGREADFIVGDGTEEDAKKVLERYHGSSSAAISVVDDHIVHGNLCT